MCVIIVCVGEKLTVLSDSRHYIQGVAWDPTGVMLANPQFRQVTLKAAMYTLQFGRILFSHGMKSYGIESSSIPTMHHT